jgi:His-Xaa-Ser system protein HxsD
MRSAQLSQATALGACGGRAEFARFLAGHGGTTLMALGLAGGRQGGRCAAPPGEIRRDEKPTACIVSSKGAAFILLYLGIPGMAVAAIEIAFDDRLFMPDVIARTAHRYTSDFLIDVSLHPGSIIVRLTPKGPATDIQDVIERFRNDALDDKLRAQVSSQTNDLHATLVRAALRAADPSSPESGK